MFTCLLSLYLSIECKLHQRRTFIFTPLSPEHCLAWHSNISWSNEWTNAKHILAYLVMQKWSKCCPWLKEIYIQIVEIDSFINNWCKCEVIRQARSWKSKRLKLRRLPDICIKFWGILKSIGWINHYGLRELQQKKILTVAESKEIIPGKWIWVKSTEFMGRHSNNDSWYLSTSVPGIHCSGGIAVNITPAKHLFLIGLCKVFRLMKKLRHSKDITSPKLHCQYVVRLGLKVSLVLEPRMIPTVPTPYIVKLGGA